MLAKSKRQPLPKRQSRAVELAWGSLQPITANHQDQFLMRQATLVDQATPEGQATLLHQATNRMGNLLEPS